MLFFALRFRVRILLYWKTLLEGITSLFSFSIYKITSLPTQTFLGVRHAFPRRTPKNVCVGGSKITGRNVLQFRKGLWYMRGTLGDCLHPQHRRKKVTNTASPQKNVAKHWHRNLKFCPTINLIEICLHVIGYGGSRSWLVIGREWDWPHDSIFHLIYFCELYFQPCR